MSNDLTARTTRGDAITVSAGRTMPDAPMVVRVTVDDSTRLELTLDHAAVLAEMLEFCAAIARATSGAVDR